VAETTLRTILFRRIIRLPITAYADYSPKQYSSAHHCLMRSRYLQPPPSSTASVVYLFAPIVLIVETKLFVMDSEEHLSPQSFRVVCRRGSVVCFPCRSDGGGFALTFGYVLTFLSKQWKAILSSASFQRLKSAIESIARPGYFVFWFVRLNRDRHL
jgi:hypothetical protein